MLFIPCLDLENIWMYSSWMLTLYLNKRETEANMPNTASPKKKWAAVLTKTSPVTGADEEAQWVKALAALRLTT